MLDTLKRYYSTKELCIYLQCSKTFLNNRKGIVFFKGIHYVVPPNTKKFLRWDILEIEKWLRSKKEHKQDKKVEDLLKRLL